MIDLDDLYYEWLLTCINHEGVTEGEAYLCSLLHLCNFKRRVGNDINRAIDGANLRKEFMSEYADANFDPNVTNNLMMMECTWLEMLIALAKAIDFLYEGGVEGRFLELIQNLGLEELLVFNPLRTDTLRRYDQHLVDVATGNVDNNRFDRDGHGGLFPLQKNDHPDQRGVEIWDQHAAYFRERLEGVLWTSTS